MNSLEKGLKFAGVISIIAIIEFYIIPGGYTNFAQQISVFVWTYKNTISLIFVGLFSIFAILGIDMVYRKNSEGEVSLGLLSLFGILFILIRIGYEIVQVWA